MKKKNVLKNFNRSHLTKITSCCISLELLKMKKLEVTLLEKN